MGECGWEDSRGGEWVIYKVEWGNLKVNGGFQVDGKVWNKMG